MLDAVIVGGGPVGLFLGCRLAQLGLDFVVLEKHAEPLQHSRSIGIHPPSLERFEQLGLVDDLLVRGIRVEKGLAFGSSKLRPLPKRLGELGFSLCPEPYTYVLTLPQYVTEGILEERLCTARPSALWRRAEVQAVRDSVDHAEVVCERDGETKRLRARVVIGCDGKHSVVRNAAGIPFKGGRYPDSYLMGDFADLTDLGNDAALYLTQEGIIESFPLPDQVRRWVVKMPHALERVTPLDLTNVVKERLGVEVPAETNTMLSSFGIERYLAKRFAEGRFALAGDAAHVVSPIGGQGMNLGWLDAWRLAEALLETKQGAGLETSLKNYNRSRRRAAQAAIFRAEFNTVMGRGTPLAPLRDFGLRGVLHTPLKRVLAHMFTMRGL